MKHDPMLGPGCGCAECTELLAEFVDATPEAVRGLTTSERQQLWRKVLSGEAGEA